MEFLDRILHSLHRFRDPIQIWIHFRVYAHHPF